MVSCSSIEVDHYKVVQFKQLIKRDIERSSVPVQWHYVIPELGEGGTCSLFGQLQEAPFDLTLHIAQSEQNNAAMAALTAIVNFVKQQGVVDWFGIYQIRTIEQQSQLLKLTYFGNPSRPLFPVNEQYAQISNNSYVALHGQQRVINHVQQYIADGGEYYTCDPKVQSELCFPYFSQTGEVLGIIDAEAFQVDVFDESALALFTAVCEILPQYLPK